MDQLHKRVTPSIDFLESTWAVLVELIHEVKPVTRRDVR